jgi:hypothetical protein
MQVMFLYAPYLVYVLYCIIIVPVGQLYVDIYLCIGQYISCALDICIVYYSFVPNIIANI